MRNFDLRYWFKRLNYSKRRFIPLAMLALALSVLLAACGGNEDRAETAPEGGSQAAATQGRSITDPCALAMPGDVAEVFGGAVASQEPGTARNCTFDIQGGSVQQVNVYHYGTASEWDGIREGYADNRGPLADVPGVGDEAFYPGDVGEYEIVVLSGDVAFAVGLGWEGGEPDAATKIKELATRIAKNVG